MTDDGLFQYTMKSLAQHCGFSDLGTLHRAVEGLFRAHIIDVRVESGSRLWACWKMNKEVIERLSSLSVGDVMTEPYLNSINTIGSKDKDFTYRNNTEGIDDLQRFFGIANRDKRSQSTENPPLFNTITQQYSNTTKPQYHKTTKREYYTDSTTIEMQSQVQSPSDKNIEEELENELVKPLDDEDSENLNELKGSKNSNIYQLNDEQPPMTEIPTETEDTHQAILDTYYERFMADEESLIPNTLKGLAAEHPRTFKWFTERLRSQFRPVYTENLQLVKELVAQYQLQELFYQRNQLF